ncbi:hypothetical protein BLOT_014868 [Blomia tropicalis]|nr:hypothetical protein BLOT_014868 [Blomia tropicalis]
MADDQQQQPPMVNDKHVLEPQTNEPSVVAPDQVPPSELSMQKPKAMAPCPSVPRNESCARETSMTATDQTKPSKLNCFVYICALD